MPAGTLRAAGASWSNGMAPMTTGDSLPGRGLGQGGVHPFVQRPRVVRYLACGTVGQQGAAGGGEEVVARSVGVQERGGGAYGRVGRIGRGQVRGDLGSRRHGDSILEGSAGGGSRELAGGLTVGQRRVAPPSTYSSCMVMWRARSEARNATASAMSSGAATRPSGMPVR